MRDFLDSRHGRHFADDVANGLWKGETLKAAIDAAIARWMGWRIDRKTSRDEGIPRGLPYLTGWVTHFQILDEMAGLIARRPSPRAALPPRQRGSGS